MSGVTGRDAAIAIAKVGTNSWGVAASVTLGVYFQSDGNMAPRVAYIDDDAFGQDFLGQAEVGDYEAPDLTWVGRARYADRGQTLLLGLAMGSPAAVTIATSAAGQTTSWRHVIDLSPNIDGLALTAAIDKVLFVDELTSAKVYGMGLAGGDGGLMDLSFKVMGSKPTNISSVNTRSTVNGATFPALTNRLLRKQGVFRFNLNSAGSLTSADALTVQECGFDFSRPQDAPHVYGQDFVDEPADNGWPEIAMNLTFPRMRTLTANSLYGAQTSGTVLKGDWTFTGARINSTDSYQVLIQFPHLEVHEWQGSIQGAQQTKPSAMMKAKEPAAAPTGMSGVVHPFRVTIITTNSLGAFA